MSLALAFIAILQVRTTFALSAYSTYDATSSVTIFRNAIVVTAVCYALSFSPGLRFPWLPTARVSRRRSGARADVWILEGFSRRQGFLGWLKGWGS